MNTALDDNLVLCLASGERVRLQQHTMRLVFEVHTHTALQQLLVHNIALLSVHSVAAFRTLKACTTALTLAPVHRCSGTLYTYPTALTV
jgi:hypothetical protein